MTTEQLRPAIDERLATAAHSTRLVPTKLDDNGGQIGALELLAAAGWTGRKLEYVLGRALIALESEWDGAERPRAPREHDIVALASVFPETLSAKERLSQARAQAWAWHEQERIRLMARLRTLPLALRSLTSWADNRGIREASAKARSLVAWWLDHRCLKCEGTMLDPVPLGGRGSVRVCTACQGTGETPLPFDDRKCQDGRLLERAMIDAKHRAMQQIKRFTASAHRF